MTTWSIRQEEMTVINKAETDRTEGGNRQQYSNSRLSTPLSTMDRTFRQKSIQEQQTGTPLKTNGLTDRNFHSIAADYAFFSSLC